MKPCNPKRRGELAELAFAHKAFNLGFRVAKPYGDSTAYDFLVGANRRGQPQSPGGPIFWKVQVKSTQCFRKGGYMIGAGHFSRGNKKKAYTPAEIDFLVVYIVPEDAWYVIPIAAFAPQKWLSFYPQNPHSKGRFECSREAWNQLAPAYLGTVTQSRVPLPRSGWPVQALLGRGLFQRRTTNG